MSLFQRKPQERDPSILERELELEECYRTDNRDTLVRLCKTRVEYALRETIDDFKFLHKTAPRFVRPLALLVLYMASPLSFSQCFLTNYDMASHRKDPVTGKYILRYSD